MPRCKAWLVVARPNLHRFRPELDAALDLSNRSRIVDACLGKRKASRPRPRRSSSESPPITQRTSKRRSKPRRLIWDDFTRRGRFLEARLVRASGGSEQRGGVQDYILHIVAADHEAHEEHDRDPRFRAFLAKAERLQPAPPMVWFGDTIFERRG